MNELVKNADWRDYIREPGEERECLTPGSQFHIHIGDDEVSVSVDLPMELPELSEDELQEMDDAMHDAMEAILAKYFEEACGIPTEPLSNMIEEPPKRRIFIRILRKDKR
jgi:hypothetical protein